MNKIHFVILLAIGCALVQGKKEEKTTNAVAKANTNILEIVQLFKSLLNQALSKADLSSVRGVLSSPLSLVATAVSVLLGGIVLMAFYESPLSPLPVPPLPQAPGGRFPPENPIVAPMNGGGAMRGHGLMQRAYRYSSTSPLHFANPELYFQDHRRMLYQPMSQPQQFNYLKSQSVNTYPTSSIKRSSNVGDVYSYVNQKNNYKPSNMDANTYHLVETPLKNTAQQSPSPSSVRTNHSSKDVTLKNDNSAFNLQASASSEHASFAPPFQLSDKKTNFNSNNLSTNSMSNQMINQLNNNQMSNQMSNQMYNQLHNQLNSVQQTSPVYRPTEEESRTNEKVSLEQYAIKDAIKEQDFDQKQLVHSQLSQIEFKNSPELAKLE